MKKTMNILALLAPLLLAGSVFAQEPSGHKDAGIKPASGQTKAAKAQNKSKPAKAVLRKVTQEEIGKQAVCPVTGEKLTVAKDTGSASYKGRTYYFCCPGCDKSFLADPEKFTVGKPAAAKVYVCPMGDYQGDKPGKCPKCGMTLQEKK